MPKQTIQTLIEGFKTDLQEYLSSKQELLQLKIAEKASQVASRSIHGVLLIIVTCFGIGQLLLTGILAFSLCFASSQEALEILQALTFGALIILGITILLWVIIYATKRRFQQRIERAVIESVLKSIEEKEQKEKGAKRVNQFYDDLTNPYETPKPLYQNHREEEDV